MEEKNNDKQPKNLNESENSACSIWLAGLNTAVLYKFGLVLGLAVAE